MTDGYRARWAQVAAEDLLSIIDYVVDRDGVDAAQRLFDIPLRRPPRFEEPVSRVAPPIGVGTWTVWRFSEGLKAGTRQRLEANRSAASGGPATSSRSPGLTVVSAVA